MALMHAPLIPAVLLVIDNMSARIRRSASISIALPASLHSNATAEQKP